VSLGLLPLAGIVFAVLLGGLIVPAMLGFVGFFFGRDFPGARLSLLWNAPRPSLSTR
jgi:hypothetical protein